MIKKLLTTAAAFAVVAVGSLIPSHGMAASGSLPTVHWTLDSWSPASGYQVPEWTLAIDRIKERTNGRFIINAVWGSGLGVKGQDALGALSKGAFQMECGPLNYWAGDMPILGVLGLPGLYSNLWENTLAKDMLEDKFLRKAFEKDWNSVLIGPITIMPPSPVWSKDPIRSLADFKGKTIRGFSPEMADMLSALGAHVVTMPFSEVYSAAQRGVMQGAITSSVGARAISIWEVWGYATEYNFASTNPATLVNKDAFDKLPGKYQAILVEEFAQANRRINYRTVEADEANWKVIEKHGLKRIKPSAEDLQKFSEIAKPLWSAWAKKRGEMAKQALQSVLTLLGK